MNNEEKKYTIEALVSLLEMHKTGIEKTINLIEKIDAEKFGLRYVINQDVYFIPRMYEENMDLLHELRKHTPLVLERYDVDCNGIDLMLVYTDDKDLPWRSKLSITLYCTDLDYALEKVGNGKCKIVEEKVKNDYSYVRKSVVCDIA